MALEVKQPGDLANDNVLVVPIIETVRTAANVPAMCDVPGIDGKVVELIGGAIVRTRDGLLSSWHDYWDTALMTRALGLATAHDLRG